MINPIIQVYEIQNPREAEEIAAMGVEHVGSVILSEDDWRVPEIQDVVKTVQGMGAKSSIIPLFNDLDAVCRVLDYYMPDIIHFCELLIPGQEGSAMREGLLSLQYEIRGRFPAVSIMRSIPIPEAGSQADFPFLELALEFESLTDFFLTDTLIIENKNFSSEQPVSGFVGITGRTCDWNMAKRLVEATFVPVILAGGLSPENVRDAIAMVQPFGVDTCTGTNMRDTVGNPIRFKKDMGRINAFIQEVRGIPVK